MSVLSLFFKVNWFCCEQSLNTNLEPLPNKMVKLAELTYFPKPDNRGPSKNIDSKLIRSFQTDVTFSSALHSTFVRSKLTNI